MTQAANMVTKALMMAFFMVAALYLTLDIMLAEGRSLAQLYFYMALGALLCGAVAARSAFFICLIATGYVDFFKRLMAVFGRPTPLDLYYILGIPPLLIAGSVLNLLIQFLIGKRQFKSIHFWSFLASTALLCLSLLQGLSSNGYRGLGDAVNQGAYAFLFFLIPELLPTVEDRQKIFRWMIPIFVGVSIYMLRHHFFGLADFEIDYLKSGLSIESRILWENGGALRGFSTMAGAGVVAVFTSIMMLVILVPMRKNGKPLGLGGKVLRGLLFVLFGYASWATVSRGGWVCGIAAFGIYFFLKSPRRAVVGYIVGFVMFASLLGFSPLLKKYDTLQWVENGLLQLAGDTSNSYTKRAIVMGTVNARIDGWVNLTTNPKVWTPLGLRFSGEKVENSDVAQYGHDFIIEFLVKYGYVPLFIVSCLGMFLLVQLNRVYFAEPPGSDGRRLCRLSLAVGGGIFVGGLGNGAQLWVYPQNFYFYLALAIVYTSYVNGWKMRRQRVLIPVAVPQDSPLLAPNL